MGYITGAIISIVGMCLMFLIILDPWDLIGKRR